jgi:pimeloyl-ACP methyl ester carboxylesterase
MAPGELRENLMPHLVGAGPALAKAAFARLVGLHRDRASRRSMPVTPRRGPPRPASIALAVAACLATTACASSPGDVRYAQSDGHRIAYRVLGHGGPVIVLLSGLGDGMGSFDSVASDLAQGATVIVFDRGGYGRSDPGPRARDGAEAERELLSVLQASGVRGPYVVLGHSLGGDFAEYFASRHPNLVAGLILEESRSPAFGARCQALRLSMCSPPAALAVFMPQGGQAEFASLEQTMSEVAGITPVQTRVLVLSRFVEERPSAYDALWAATQGDLAARYPGSRRLTAPRGGHYIHRDAREWFLEKVRAFLASTAQDAGRQRDRGAS